MKYLIILLLLVGCSKPEPKPRSLYAIGDEVEIKSSAYRNCPVAGVVNVSFYHCCAPVRSHWNITYALKIKKGQNEYCTDQVVFFDEEDIKRYRKPTLKKKDKWLDDFYEINDIKPYKMPESCESCALEHLSCLELQMNKDIRSFPKDLCDIVVNKCKELNKCK